MRMLAPLTNLRICESQKSQSYRNQICAVRRGRDSLYTSRDIPDALHDTEVADEMLVPGVRRSASHAQAQLCDPGDGQPFSPCFNHCPLDAGSADDVEWAAIGEVPFAPGFGRACPKPALTLRHLLMKKPNRSGHMRIVVRLAFCVAISRIGVRQHFFGDTTRCCTNTVTGPALPMS
jgi:hypothetical protein